METDTLTIMFTDIKGFTNKTSNKSREQIQKLLDTHDDLIRPVFKKFKGKVIKTIGDAFLVTFKSPTNAVLCGMAVQKVLDKHNEFSKEDDVLEVRIAINSGEVNIRGNDVFGEPVNIAARIEGIAEAGEIYFTESVYLAMNKNEIPSAEIGHRYLKGIPHEVKVYKVLKEGKSLKKWEKGKTSLALKAPNGRRKKFFKWALIIFGILFFFGFIGALTEQSEEVDITPQEKIEGFMKDAEIAVRESNFELAESLLEELSNQKPEQVPVKVIVMGSRLFELTGDYEGMVEILWYAVDKNPKNPVVWERILTQARKGVEHFPKDTSTGQSAREIASIAKEKIGIFEN